MTRTWKTLAITAAFVAVLTGGRCTAQTIDPAPAAPKADDLRQELDQLRSNTIRSFQAAKKEIDAMKEDIAHLRKDLDEVRNAKAFTRRKSEDAATGAATQTTRKELEALKEEIARLGKSLDDLNQTHVSAYPPAQSATGKGTIRLSNTYPASVTIIVNGESYTLAPGETRVLAGRPAGTFTYEVVGVQPAVERTLVANGTFPIVVHP